MFRVIERVGTRQAYKLASKLSDRDLKDVLEGRPGTPKIYVLPVPPLLWIR